MIASPLSFLVAEQVLKASQLYHRLVIIVGPLRSGKTSVLRELRAQHGWPLVNVNLSLSERLLEHNARQRALRVARIVDDVVREQNAETVMLDNIEMLFHPDLRQDPLRLLQSLSRNRTVIATWRGIQHGQSLIYAAPEHPEYRRFEDPQAVIVPTQTARSVISAPSVAQEHLA